VRFVGYLPHDQSVALLRSADLLFLPMHDLPPGERARIVPGKTYEYMAARRPILAAVPEGDARDFVRASGLGHVCGPADRDGMLAILEARLRAFRAREPDPPVDERFLARFERGALAAQLAEVLEAALRDGAPPSRPGAGSEGAAAAHAPGSRIGGGGGAPGSDPDPPPSR